MLSTEGTVRLTAPLCLHLSFTEAHGSQGSILSCQKQQQKQHVGPAASPGVVAAPTLCRGAHGFLSRGPGKPRSCGSFRMRGVAEGTGVPISSCRSPGAAVCAGDRSMVLAFALRLLGSSALLLATAAAARGKGDRQVCGSGAFVPWPSSSSSLLFSLILLLFPVEADRSPVLVPGGPRHARS